MMSDQDELNSNHEEEDERQPDGDCDDCGQPGWLAYFAYQEYPGASMTTWTACLCKDC